MAYPKKELNVVHECDDEVTGEPRCWAIQGGDPKTRGAHYIWICKYDEKEFIIEDSMGR